MMIPPRVLSRMGVHPRGVVHVGAHEAEEHPWYVRGHWGPVIWVEMLPDKAELLRQKFADDPNNRVIEAACWSDERELRIHRSAQTQPSSLLEPKEVLRIHPHVTFEPETTSVTTRRLDAILPPDARFDFINIDAQGAELEILKGLGTIIDRLRWVYVEINEVEHYSGCALLPEMDAFLFGRGFARAIRLKADDAGWGDALYVRRSDPSVRQLKISSRLYHSYKAIRRPTHTPAWDNWRSG